MALPIKKQKTSGWIGSHPERGGLADIQLGGPGGGEVGKGSA